MYVKRRGFTLCKSKALYCFGASSEIHVIKFSYRNIVFSIFLSQAKVSSLIMLQTYLIKIIFFFIISFVFVCDMMARPERKKEGR